MPDNVVVNTIGWVVAILSLIVMCLLIAVFAECMYDMTKAVQDYFKTMKWLDRLKEREDEEKRLREERRAVSVLRKTDGDAVIQEKKG
mgnify:CR=1 FL=1